MAQGWKLAEGKRELRGRRREANRKMRLMGWTITFCTFPPPRPPIVTLSCPLG